MKSRKEIQINPFNFTKMHGLGNDMLIIDARNKICLPLPVIQLSDRHTGIGFDQMLLLTKSKGTKHFYCDIYNSDGSEAFQCGNGLRCMARFLHEEGITTHTQLILSTKGGDYPVTIRDYQNITVDMGIPEFQNDLCDLNLLELKGSLINIGNKHAILAMESLEFDIRSLSVAIKEDPRFQHPLNLGYMKIINSNHIQLRTFEHGAGETKACGSSACAAVCAGILHHGLSHLVKVSYEHGDLWIEWKEKDRSITMTGPASRVYAGNLHPFWGN